MMERGKRYNVHYWHWFRAPACSWVHAPDRAWPWAHMRILGHAHIKACATLTRAHGRARAWRWIQVTLGTCAILSAYVILACIILGTRKACSAVPCPSRHAQDIQQEAQFCDAGLIEQKPSGGHDNSWHAPTWTRTELVQPRIASF